MEDKTYVSVTIYQKKEGKCIEIRPEKHSLSIQEAIDFLKEMAEKMSKGEYL